MHIVWGTSVKRQAVGFRNLSCVACKQETLHVLTRTYAVAHIYWFPLFALNASYTKGCERCTLITPTGEPAPGTVLRQPFMHRMGFIFPVSLLVLPLLFALGAVVTGIGTAAPVSPEDAATLSKRKHFHATAADYAVRDAVQALFDQMDLQRSAVDAKSATTNGHTIRLLTAQYSKLRQMSEHDCLRLLTKIEEIVDASFANDEVFIGLKGRVLWGGHAHRRAGELWIQVAGQIDAEMDAFARYRDLEIEAAAAPAADAQP